MASASGASDGSALAAVEVASPMVGCSGLASATVKPDTPALRSVSPGILDGIGRNLCRAGESLHVIDVRGGRVTLTPVASWSVHGSDDPASWLYRVTLNGPDSTRVVTLPSRRRNPLQVLPKPRRSMARTFTRPISYRHGAGCRVTRDGHKRRTEFHPIANAHPSTRCGRLWRG